MPSALSRGHCAVAINPVMGSTGLCHHPVFRHFTPLILDNASQLQVALPRSAANTAKKLRRSLPHDPKMEVVIDWLGVRVPRQEYCHISYYRQRWPHALRAQLCDLLKWAQESSYFPQHDGKLPLPLPAVSEEYFEYIDVLESVVAYHKQVPEHAVPQRPFTMLELGAGFGFWTLTAHAALRQLRPRAVYEFALMEIDFGKQAMLRQTLALNDVLPSSTRLVHSALGDRDDTDGVIQNGNVGWYAVHACDPKHPEVAEAGCRGKKFLGPKSERDPAEIKKLNGAVAPITSLPTILAKYNVVDLLDMDVQGAEWTIFSEPEVGEPSEATRAAFDALDAKVLRVHIGTHGAMNATAPTMLPYTAREAALKHSFLRRGWSPTWTVGVTNGGCVFHEVQSKHHFRSTRWGPVCMADGAMGFINERLRARVETTVARA